LTGRVTNLTDYGCFVEIEEGVEGLVHVSEMDWTNKNIHPSKVVNVGDEVEVMVLEIDEERRRISLGLKQCKANPWQSFAEAQAKGDKVTGKIKSITDFGIFIGLEGGIDGLVHLSDISWNVAGEEA
ncbi:S1 RNA-binding domain-containing protein, partial [Enterobacter hormaechei]|nr:S1 RNA-binding domain-containing protein [Enterobacter hormaechei]